MTKTLESQDLARRYVYDPQPSVIHINDMINRVKDGVYAKDKLSDYVISMLLFAVFMGVYRAVGGGTFSSAVCLQGEKDSAVACQSQTFRPSACRTPIHRTRWESHQ